MKPDISDASNTGAPSFGETEAIQHAHEEMHEIGQIPRLALSQSASQSIERWVPARLIDFERRLGIEAGPITDLLTSGKT
jgi:hypothetical protein